MPNLQGKVAIVSGASAGIGRAYALALASAGATTIAVARTLGPVDCDAPVRNTLVDVVRAAESLPGRIYAQAGDVESESDLAGAVDHTMANFGRIDVLVNNAGLMWSSPRSTLAATTGTGSCGPTCAVLTLPSGTPHRT